MNETPPGAGPNENSTSFRPPHSDAESTSHIAIPFSGWLGGQATLHTVFKLTRANHLVPSAKFPGLRALPGLLQLRLCAVKGKEDTLVLVTSLLANATRHDVGV